MTQLQNAQVFVDQRREELRGTKHNITLSALKVRYSITKLMRNCAPARDGLTAEHLSYAIDSGVTLHIANILTLCLQFSVVPDLFANGVLVPIPKKPGCDTTIPKNWRPIIVSYTLSKLLEMFIIDESADHIYSDLQFGFVAGRGTEIATTLLHDVIS